MTEQEVTREILSETEQSVKQFKEGVETTQNSLWREMLLILTGLKKSPDGNILPNTENVRVLRTISNRLTSIVVNNKYVQKVERFMKSFLRIRDLNEDFYSGVPGFNPRSAVLREVLDSSIALTRESLLGSGINQAVIGPIETILKDGITSGSSLVEMEQTLRTTILGDPNRLGNLDRYTSQITRDALNQFSRNYSQSVSASAQMEWYYYSGSIIEDTRSYCQERAGKYFHKKEVEQVPAQWSGKIPGTNAGNIFINAGGFNCRHLWQPVLINVVPRSVIQRNISNGNYVEPST